MPVVPIVAEQARSASPLERRQWCEQLEAGQILFFPESPIPLPPADEAFLLGREQTGSSLHKNIAYKPAADAITGLGKEAGPDVDRLRAILRAYSGAAESFLQGFLPPYRGHLRRDYASFRPQEEQNRDLPLRKRNDLLHTDAFPTRPTGGARILRFFSNIHPTRTRDWVVAEPFRALLPRFAPAQIAPRREGPLTHSAKSLAVSLGLGSAIPSLKRGTYDDFMMRFHNFLKENKQWQRDASREAIAFPPGSSWMVLTDTVPHAVLAGQYALEQTFLLAPEGQVAPEHAPLRVLDELIPT